MEEIKQVPVIIKIGKYEYMNKLQKDGQIFMQRLSNFRNIESDEVGDKDEGLTSIHQINDIKSLTVNGKDMTDSLVNNLKIRVSNAPNPFIYCMYGINRGTNAKTESHNIDKKCFEFGDTAIVIYDPPEFINRIEALHLINFNKVTYINQDTYSGDMTPFMKFDNYKHQNEFRIAFEKNIKSNTFSFDIGSIEDISIMVEVSKLNPVELFYN